MVFLPVGIVYADEALYRAKSDGRNCVRLSEDIEVDADMNL